MAVMQQLSYILCVDDDEEDCHLLSESIHLYSPGIEVKFLATGDLAVKSLKENPGKIPSMIILDINIPGMDGKRTFLEMRKILGDNVFPAMFLTTTPRPADVEFAQQNGLSVMRKPSSMQGYRELAATVLEILHKDHSA